MSAHPESRVQALLDERSLALARRGRGQVATGATRPFLLCLAGGQPIALALSETGSVIAETPPTPIPGAPAALAGIVALPGAIVTVLDLARALGLGPESDADGRGHLVRLRGRNAAIALAVRRALGFCQVEVARIEQSGAGATPGRTAAIFGHEAVSGYAPRGSGAALGIEDGFCIVDPSRLLRRYLP